MRSDLVDLDVVVRRETEKAYGLADPFKPGNIIWVPKSRCAVGEIRQPQKTATITLSRADAEDKGLV